MKACVTHNNIGLLRGDWDNGLFSGETFGGDLNLSFNWRNLIDSGLVYLDYFPVGESRKSIVEFENIDSRR